MTEGNAGKGIGTYKIIAIIGAIAAVVILVLAGRSVLTPSEAILSLSSIPPGALVMVDGKSIGFTPVEYKTKPGTVALEFLADGFPPRDTSLIVTKGDVLTVTVTMVNP